MFRIIRSKARAPVRRAYGNFIPLATQPLTGSQLVADSIVSTFQRCFVSTRGPGKGGQGSHSGNRGGQGKRGPNQRVPNNPGQNRGGRKNNRRGDGPTYGDNQKRTGDSQGNNRRSNRRESSRPQVDMSRVEHSAFDADGNWIMPSMRNKRKVSKTKEPNSKSLDEWEAGPKVRRKRGKADKYGLGDVHEEVERPARSSGSFDGLNKRVQHITHEDILLYQLEDNIEFIKFVEREAAQNIWKTADTEERLKYALRMLHLRASQIRFTDIMKDVQEDLEYGFKVTDLITTVMAEKVYSNHCWAMWSAKHKYELGDIVIVPTEQHFGRYFYKLTSEDVTKQGKPGTRDGSGWKLYEFTDPYVYSKVHAMNEMLELYIAHGDDGIRYQQFVDGYSDTKPRSKDFNAIDEKRKEIINRYREIDMAGNVLRKYWSHPSFNAQTFADLNEKASKYFASIMLEVGVEKELEALKMVDESANMMNSLEQTGDNCENVLLRNNFKVSISNGEVRDYRKKLEDLMAANVDDESGFGTMKESDLKNIEDDDLKMNLFLNRKLQLIRDTLIKESVDLQDLPRDFHNEGTKYVEDPAATIFDGGKDIQSDGGARAREIALNCLHAQQLASKSDRRTKMKNKISEMYSGTERERKLDAFQRVQKVLDDHMSTALSDYKDEMNNVYGKDGFFRDELGAIGNIYSDLSLNYTTGVEEDNAKLDFWHYMEDNTDRDSNQYIELDAYRRYQTWKESELDAAEEFVNTSHHFSRVDEIKEAEKTKEFLRDAKAMGLEQRVDIIDEIDVFSNNQFPGEIIPLVQDKIYDLNCADPEYWTAERLSQQFRVNPIRVKAIIKIKEHALDRIRKDRDNWNNFAQGRDEVLNQICNIWSKRLKIENGGSFPEIESVELEDIRQFVANTLTGVKDDSVSEASDENGEGMSDEEVESVSGEESEKPIAEDGVEVVADPDLINDAKELKILLETVESKQYWRRWNDLNESVSMDDDENDNALRKMAPDDKDLDYVFDIYDHAMNRAYLAVFPLYFEHYVDKDFAKKALKRSERFVTLSEGEELTEAKRKIIDRVGYVKRRRQGKRDSGRLIEKQQEGWTLDYTPIPSTKKFR